MGRSIHRSQCCFAGDLGKIIIKDGANVQENCTLHVFPGIPTILEESAHIGHGAIIHSAHIGKKLFGWDEFRRSMDNAKIGNECIIGALSFVPTGFISENRKLIVGSPAKIIREVSDEMIAWKPKEPLFIKNWLVKVKTAIQPCEPYTEFVEQTPTKIVDYSVWTSNGAKFPAFHYNLYFSTSVSLSGVEDKEKIKGFPLQSGAQFRYNFTIFPKFKI